MKEKKKRTEARTAHYRIVRAITSQVCDRDLFALLYYELFTDKRRRANITNKQTNKKKTQMRAKATPITKGMEDVLRRKSEGREKAASDAKRAAGRRDFAVYREDATLPHRIPGAPSFT